MGVVLSAYVYTIKDIQGNPRTEGWITVTFRPDYRPGGDFFDLSPYFRFIEHTVAYPMSGTEEWSPQPNDSDFPSVLTPISHRIKLMGIQSAAISVLISGQGIQVASGTLLTTSGIAGVQSGFAVIGTLFSGRIAGAIAGTLGMNGPLYSEVVSGRAVSGAVAKLHVIGY